MLNFIQVSFCFLLFLGLGLGLGLGSVIGLGLGFRVDNLKNILKYLIGGAANTLDIPCPQTPVNGRTLTLTLNLQTLTLNP